MIKPRNQSKDKINLQRIRQAIQRFNNKERLQLFQELKQITWEDRFHNLLSSLRARRKKHPVSDEEIDSIVEEVRAELYAERHR